MTLLLLQLYGKIIIPKEYMQHKFVLSFNFFLYSPNQSKVIKFIQIILINYTKFQFFTQNEPLLSKLHICHFK